MENFSCGRSCMGNLEIVLFKHFSCSWNAWNIESGSIASCNKYLEPMLMKLLIFKGHSRLAFLIRCVSIKWFNFLSNGTDAQWYALHIFLWLEFVQVVLQFSWITVLKWYPEYMLLCRVWVFILWGFFWHFYAFNEFPSLPTSFSI